MTNDVKLEDLKSITKFGDGNFSELYKGTWKCKDEEKKIVVIKLQDIYTERIVQTEFESLSKVNHENVLKLHGITADKYDRVLLLMENVDCGTLHNYLHGRGKEKRPFKFVDVINWMLQVAKGCEYLHKMNSGNKDNQLMTCNMLLSFNYRKLKICNFGSFSQSIDKLVSEGDAFCFGIVLWELLTREDPFGVERMRANKFRYVHPKLNDIKNDENSDQMKKLIEHCWDEDPKERITMRSLALHFGLLYQQSSGTTKEIPWGEVTLEEPSVGAGAFGEVYKGTWKTIYGHTRTIAAKRLFNRNNDEDTNNEDAIAKEVTYLSLLNHENIIKLWGFTKNIHNQLYIVTEFADCGSLSSYLHRKKKRRLTMRGKLNWLLQFTNAVAYLHEMDPPILHRDLKPDNVLLTNNYKTLKICDFGLARRKATQMSKEAGTHGYMAPELANLDNEREKIEYTEKCDVYSFGIILWEIMSEEEPFEDLEPFAIYYNVVIDNERPDSEKLILEQKLEHLKALAEKCWTRDPNDRPKMKEVSFILGIDPYSSETNPLELRSLPQATDEDYNPKD